MATKSVSKDAFQQYLKEARGWEVDKICELLNSRRVAWIFGSAAVVVAVVTSLTATLLATKQPDPPPVIRVDNSTGIVDVVRRQVDATTTYPEVVSRYFLWQYIRFREGYSRELADEFYVNVGLMSAGAEQRRYYEFFNPKNPQSPLAVYGSTARVRVERKSVSFLKPTQALVRWMGIVERNGERPVVTHWASTIVFTYTTLPIKDKDRDVNPVGFQVTEYRRDVDSSVNEGQPQAAAPAGAAVAQTGPSPTSPPATQGNGVVLFPGQAPGGQAAPVVPAIQAQ